MNINRHNYEEYFILYMDNELGSDERRQVEALIEKNSDLKEELDILLQYKLVPDTDIVFAGKEDLMIPVAAGNTGDVSVNLSNYEEWFVLYSDNELTTAQQIAVEQFISSHPYVKKELALLQRTKLQPEAIIFAHKESLYRREENPDSYRERPLPFRWLRLWQAFGDRRWRVAAAAVLIIAAGLTAVIVVNKRSVVKPDLAKGQGNEQKVNVPATVVTVNEKNTPVLTDDHKKILPGDAKQATNNIAIKNKIHDDKPVNTIQSPVKKEEQVVVNTNENKPTNNLPKPLNNLNNNPLKNDVANNKNPKEITDPSNALTKNNVTTDPDDPSLVKSVALVEPIDLNQSEKKGKLRGFFRKVTRTFEKRTNIDATDDDKLLVGGLAFKLK